MEDEQLFLLLGFYTVLGEFYTKKFCGVFSLVVSLRKIFVSCVSALLNYCNFGIYSIVLLLYSHLEKLFLHLEM